MTNNNLILQYYEGFKEQLPNLPKGIQLLNPYDFPETKIIIKSFYDKYFTDTNKRKLILGINPGRHGAGTTGIPFTDPKRLSLYCNINSSDTNHEPSSEFVYKVIENYGGVNKFYADFFISSISPIGFTKNGINFNYYDDKKLENKLKPYIVHQMNKLLQFDFISNKVICWGEGKNHNFLCKLNDQFAWFDEIIPLPHPRYIIQYKRSRIGEYIDRYLEAFSKL